MRQGHGCPYHAGHETQCGVSYIRCSKPGCNFDIIVQFTKPSDYNHQVTNYCGGQECTYRYCEIGQALNGWRDAQQYRPMTAAERREMRKEDRGILKAHSAPQGR